MALSRCFVGTLNDGVVLDISVPRYRVETSVAVWVFILDSRAVGMTFPASKSDRGGPI
jgi:hypothetical protein